jgi:hypothetical protein
MKWLNKIISLELSFSILGSADSFAILKRSSGNNKPGPNEVRPGWNKRFRS